MLESFEEVSFIGGEGSFKPGNVLEIEGKESQYIYWIISGEVHFYKKIDNIYQVKDKK